MRRRKVPCSASRSRRLTSELVRAPEKVIAPGRALRRPAPIASRRAA